MRRDTGEITTFINDKDAFAKGRNQGIYNENQILGLHYDSYELYCRLFFFVASHCQLTYPVPAFIASSCQYTSCYQFYEWPSSIWAILPNWRAGSVFDLRKLRPLPLNEKKIVFYMCLILLSCSLQHRSVTCIYYVSWPLTDTSYDIVNLVSTIIDNREKGNK